MVFLLSKSAHRIVLHVVVAISTMNLNGIDGIIFSIPEIVCVCNMTRLTSQTLILLITHVHIQNEFNLKCTLL